MFSQYFEIRVQGETLKHFDHPGMFVEWLAQNRPEKDSMDGARWKLAYPEMVLKGFHTYGKMCTRKLASDNHENSRLQNCMSHGVPDRTAMRSDMHVLRKVAATRAGYRTDRLTDISGDARLFRSSTKPKCLFVHSQTHQISFNVCVFKWEFEAIGCQLSTDR